MKHAEGKFTGSNKLNLYWQSWVPEGTPVAVLLIVHGLAEHSGRYTNPVELLRAEKLCRLFLRSSRTW